MKLESIVLKTSLLLVITLLVSGCGGAEQRKAKYLARGSEYLEQQNYDKAIVELKNVLQIDPKHAEAYYLMGRAEEKKGNLQRAFGNYSKAAELDPNNIAAQARVGRVYLLVGDKTKALEKADVILQKHPADIEGRTLRAAIYAVSNETESAIKLVTEVLKDDPAFPDAVDLLSSIYFTKGQKEKAVEVLEKGINANSKNVMLRLRLVQLYADAKELNKAEDLLKELVSLEPGKMQIRTSLAMFYARSNQLDKAENILREAVQADPKDEMRQIVLADFLAERRGAEAAEKYLLSAIQDYPKRAELRFGLAQLYGQMQRNDKAEEIYRAIISDLGTEPSGLRARNSLADLLLGQRNVKEASKLAEEVLKENPRDNEALEIKGRAQLLLRNPHEAINAFRSILKDQPTETNILVLLADAHMLNGEKEIARENLQKALKSNPASVPARIKLAQYFLVSKNTSEATKIIDDGLKAAPNNLNLLVAKIDVLAAKKDSQGVRKIAESIKAKHPNSFIGYFTMGKLLTGERKYAEARREFLAARQKQPNALEPLTAVVNTYLLQNRSDEAIQWLNGILQESPQDALVNEVLGEIYASQKNYSEAESRFRKAIQLNPKWTIPYGNLAKLMQAKGDLPGSILVYEEGRKAAPDDISLMLYLAVAYEQSGAYDKGIEMHERILEMDPDNAVSANNLASLLSDHRTDKKSQERARALAERFLSDEQPPHFRDTLGWVYYRSGDFEKAIKVLEKVVKEMPDVGIFRYHLGMAYLKGNNPSAAKIHLTKAVESKQKYTGMEEAKSTLAQLK